MKRIRPFVVLIILTVICLPCQSQLATTQKVTKSSYLANLYPSPAKIIPKQPPARTNRFDLSSLALNNTYSTRSLNFANQTTNSKILQNKIPRPVQPNKPLLKNSSDTTASTLNNILQMERMDLILQGYLARPLQKLLSLETTQGRNQRSVLRRYTENLYQFLLEAQRLNNYGFFKKIIADQIQSIIMFIETIQKTEVSSNLKTNDYINVVGINNSVTHSNPSAKRNFITVSGNNNIANGNQIMSGGNSVKLSGNNLFAFGRDVNVVGSNNIVIGMDKTVVSNNLMILGDFIIDLNRKRQGFNYIKYVKGVNPNSAPYR